MERLKSLLLKRAQSQAQRKRANNMICVVGTRSEKSLLDLLGLNEEIVDSMKASELKDICKLLDIEYTTASEVKEIIKEMLKEEDNNG